MSQEHIPVEVMVQSARSEAAAGKYEQAEYLMEIALLRQVELNGGADALNCFDILCDLSHIAGLRARDGRKSVLYKRAIAILLAELGETERCARFMKQPHCWLTVPR
jgi:hypothetical protein